jgi:hypothetical protein
MLELFTLLFLSKLTLGPLQIGIDGEQAKFDSLVTGQVTVEEVTNQKIDWENRKIFVKLRINF